MRTLWVCEVTGGPFKFSPTKPGKTSLGLEEAHRDLKISPEEFDEVAAELGRSLDFAKVPEQPFMRANRSSVVGQKLKFGASSRTVSCSAFAGGPTGTEPTISLLRLLCI